MHVYIFILHAWLCPWNVIYCVIQLWLWVLENLPLTMTGGFYQIYLTTQALTNLVLLMCYTFCIVFYLLNSYRTILIVVERK